MWLNWPNRITIVRILLVAPLVVGLLNAAGSDVARRLSLALLVLMGLSDIVDGLLARRLKQETVLGRFLDPVGDKLLITAAVVILALPQTGVADVRLPNWVPVIAIGKEVVTVVGFSLIRLTTGRTFVRPRPAGKACTLVQVAMIGAVLLYPDLPAGIRPGVIALWYTASGLAVVAALDYIRAGNRFASQAAPRPGSEGVRESGSKGE